MSKGNSILTNTITIICTFFIICLLIITLPILKTWIYTPESVTEVPSNIASTSTALIVALISIITMIVSKNQTNKSIEQTKQTIENNKKFNDESLKKTDSMIKDNIDYYEKTLKLTNESLNQNEEIMYVQLRFQDAKKSLYYLQNEINNAWTIYNELLELKPKEKFFDPRGFIIAQYTIWTYDLELFEHTPLGLKNKFYSIPSKEYPEDHLNFNEYFDTLLSVQDSHLDKYKIDLKSYYEFNQFIKEFKENCISGRFIHSFKELYNSNINAPTIINFLIQINSEINQRSVEDLIYEEKLLRINHREMKRKLNEFNSTG